MTETELIAMMKRDSRLRIVCETISQRLAVLKFFDRHGFDMDDIVRGYFDGDKSTDYMHPFINSGVRIACYSCFNDDEHSIPFSSIEGIIIPYTNKMMDEKEFNNGLDALFALSINKMRRRQK